MKAKTITLNTRPQIKPSNKLIRTTEVYVHVSDLEIQKLIKPIDKIIGKP